MTLSALGIFSAAGAGGAAFSSDYELIETQILGSAQATVSFINLGTYASSYKHLQMRAVTKASAASYQRTDIKINAATGNHSWHELLGNGSDVGSSGLSGRASIPSWDSAPTSSNVATGVIIDILDFASTTKNKTIRTFYGYEPGDGNRNIVLSSGALHETPAMTSISFTVRGDAYAIGSRFSLYGLKG